MNGRGRYELILLLAAGIWGFAFIAQRAGVAIIGPFTFTAIRFTLGSLFLVVFLFLRRKKTDSGKPGQWSVRRTFVHAIPIGIVLFCAANAQQIGLKYTTAGKAGFITGLYVIMVPVFGLLVKQRPSWSVWTGAILAAGGMYLLSVTSDFTLAWGDTLVLICAVLFAIHVLCVGHVSGKADPVTFACMQFAVCAAISFVAAFALESMEPAAIRRAAIPILYGGVVSVGIGYTLQVVGQRHVPPAPAAIIMSLESVFAAVGGYLAGMFLAGFDDEILSLRGLLGCVLMLAGMFLAQVPQKKGSKGSSSLNTEH